MRWSNIYRGMIMGATDLIPGISGSTIAIGLGIYEDLLSAISGIFSRDWQRHLGFLIPLGIGMGAALLSLSRVIDFLLEHHPVPTYFFFLGLIVGVLPLLFRRADARRTFTPLHVVVVIISAVIIASMTFMNPDRTVEPITALTFTTGTALFFSGWLASMAMLLPGISGSLILLVIGVYPTAIHALSTLNLPLILVIGAGVGIGFIVSSKVIHHLLVNHTQITYAAIIGMIFGSVVVIYPGWAESTVMIVSFLTFLSGLGLMLYFGRRDKAA